MKQTSGKVKEVSSLAICPDCNGAGGNNQHWACGRCDGVGGVRERYQVGGSIYEGMAAAVFDEQCDGRTVAHCGHYSDAVAIAESLNARTSDPRGFTEWEHEPDEFDREADEACAKSGGAE